MEKAKSKNKAKTEIEDPNEVKGIHQFIMGEKLGQGTFGKVKLATNVVTGEKVAIKILEKDKICEQEDKDRVEKEIKILKMIRHNNLIQVYQIIQTPKLIYIIMEYSSGKDLFNHIVSSKKLKEDEACLYFQQIIEGVDFCHKMKICHRDLKPENLLLEGKTVKLIDFGLSNTWGKSGKMKTACGSPSYAAPEMILGESDYYGSRVDIWSCGVILYVMICGFLPFEDSNQDKLYAKIIEGKFALPSFVSDQCKDLIRKIMNVDQEKRFTIQEIKSHPWYKSLPTRVNEGLLPNQIILPTDEEILEEMKEKGFKIDDVRESIIMNKHNHLSTSYYLLVKKKIRNGIPSESDMFSDRYIKYIKDPENQLSKFNNNLNLVLEHRLNQAKLRQEEIERLEKERKEQPPDFSSFNFVAAIPQEDSISIPDEDENNNKNPFQVNINIKKSIKEVNFIVENSFNKNDNNNLKTKVTSNKTKNKSKNKTRNELDKERMIKKEKRLNKERPKNSSTTFDCTDISNVKAKTLYVTDKYTDLVQRVKRLKENIKFGIKTKNEKEDKLKENPLKKDKSLKTISTDRSFERLKKPKKHYLTKQEEQEILK